MKENQKALSVSATRNLCFDAFADEDEDAVGSTAVSKNQRKSLAPLYIYIIVSSSSSKCRHMTIAEIADQLAEYPYELKLERKAISRALNLLVEEDFGILHESRNGGWWYDKKQDYMGDIRRMVA